MLSHEIEEIVLKGIKNPRLLDRYKREFSKENKTFFPTNTEILATYRHLVSKGIIKPNLEFEKTVCKKKIRSLSGIVSVSVLTKPYPCPGNCLFCPTQKNVPKSYLDNEPAVMRAISNKFDPFKQVKSRILSLDANGHPTDKIELIVIGGTWSFLPKHYQTWFIKRCFDACNQKASSGLLKSQSKNETSKNRIIGITIETRPDFISKEEIKRLRRLGITRVELGVQSIYDDVLKLNRRGHNTSKTIEATKLLKDAGFKICYHLMPNLYGSNPKRDKEMFSEIFKNTSFQPDLLKIYPCAVLKTAPGLYRLYQQKKFRPYSEKELIELFISVKENIPEYCRIQRLIRDIPSTEIAAGSRVTNLRQEVLKELNRRGKTCRCIRCREIREAYSLKKSLKLFRKDYEASQGTEIFLSFEDQRRKNIYSLLRLRISQDQAIIRELHTYGKAISISSSGNSPQHKGLGLLLIKEAERIAKEEFSRKKMRVISGIGVRDYYRRKAGYRLENTYMVKDL